MVHLIFAFAILSVLFIFLTSSVFAGRKLGRWYLNKNGNHSLQIVTVAEGAVFALLGLLIAFTFSDSYTRFEERKMHIIKEANVYESAYLRLDLLAPSTQPPLRQLFRDYVDTRLHTFDKFPFINQIESEHAKSLQIQAQIWQAAMAALKTTNDGAATEMLVPALTDMFEAGNTGYLLAWVHSPLIIFILLIGIATLGAFLAGYSTANSEEHNTLYTFSYIIITTFTIFLIINLELPRVGMVRLAQFDQVVADTRNSWN